MNHLGSRPARQRAGRFVSALAAVCIAGLATVAATAAPAAAATTTLTSPTTPQGVELLSVVSLTGTSVLGVTATADLETELHWSQPAELGTEFDPNLVRQGRSLDPIDSYARTGAGNMGLEWTLEDLEVSWDAIGPLDLGSPSFSASGPCDLKAGGANYGCHLQSSSVPILDPFPIPGPYVRLRLVADVTVTPEGLDTFRAATFGGNPDGTANLSLGETPIEDDLDIPCTVGAGDTLMYDLGQVSTSPGVSVQTSLEFEVGVVIPNFTFPFPPDLAFRIPFATPTVPVDATSGAIDMSGAGASFDMGPVQANNIPPVANAGGPYSGDEGSPVSFNGSGSTSICGEPTLRWDFSDGGVAFGDTPQHTFADGDVLYSGLLTATDVTGLASVIAFSVDIDNVAPSVGVGPDKTSLWGVPVPFHANGSDPGSIDMASLLYSWDFDDPASPIGGVGQDVSHVFANPGTYLVEGTVTDKDGATGTDTVQVAVTKRDTTSAYSGPVQSTPSKIVTLTGTLTDELGQPVAGRTVTFALGTQSGVGVTDAAGLASTSFKLTQKKGTYSVSMTFGGDAKYEPSANATSFEIGK
jgi:hypothetical protein